MRNRSNDVDDDTIYEGGKNTKAKKAESQGGFLAFFGFHNKNNSESKQDNQNSDWNSLTEAQKKDKIKMLWSKARRYNNKLRFQARLQKMAESNLKEMMIDDINEDAEEEN